MIPVGNECFAANRRHSMSEVMSVGPYRVL
jgi:hypothetical protein